jgi:hypothetical protein
MFSSRRRAGREEPLTAEPVIAEADLYPTADAPPSGS